MDDYKILKIVIAILSIIIIGFVIYLSITYSNCKKKDKDNKEALTKNT